MFAKKWYKKLLDQAKDGKTEGVRTLVTHKGMRLNINIQNDFGNTPLCLAAQNGHMTTVEVLLENGADPNIKNQPGDNPLLWAAHKGNLPIVKALLAHNADIETFNEDGLTPLQAATQQKHLTVAAYLIEQGADITARNNNGRSAFEMALDTDHSGLIEMFIRHAKTKNIQLDSTFLPATATEEPTAQNDNAADKSIWLVTDDMEIARVSDKKLIGQRITEVFNFRSQNVITICRDTEQKQQNVSRDPFRDFAPEYVEAAAKAYEKETGTKPPLNTTYVEKQKAPIPKIGS